MQLKDAKKGDRVRLGEYGRKGDLRPLTWVVIGKPTGQVLLMTEFVEMLKGFDAAGWGFPEGDNRWRDCTLRHWLNSDAAGGEVDFGPHPPPEPGRMNRSEFPYDNEQGFLRYFSAADRELLVETEVVTPVCSTYSQQRKNSKDKTKDRVWVLSFEEYKKLDKDVKKGKLSKAFIAEYDRVDDTYQYWSRTALDGLGTAILDHWTSGLKSANSGTYCEWGVRPVVAMAGSTAAKKSGKVFRVEA